MIGDEDLDAMLAMLADELDDAELDRRAARFGRALRRLRDDPAEATRIDALVTESGGHRTAAALAIRAAGGDPGAFAEIVERYAPLVWSICTRFRLSRSDAEDVAQNVWLLLVEQLGNLREPAALPGWLATTTRRECLRIVTSAQKSERLGTKLDEALQFVDSHVVDEEILTAERNAALRAAFAELPLRCQQLLSMLMAEPPCSYAQISEELSIPIGSIGPQRARCLERLRRGNAFITRDELIPSPTPGGEGHGHDGPSGR
jgi:RNA polymerase sigma factor (sigma-70 family)